jgi:anti-sigma regulatory factor (Ser/Thr protein kinase)
MEVDDSSARILSALAKRGPLRSSEVAEVLGVSRQAAHGRLRSLVQAGWVEQKGAGRATRYQLVDRRWVRQYEREGLAEDDVYRHLVAEMRLADELDRPARSVVSYALTELVNNAIDHSGGTFVRVSASWRPHRLQLEVEDDGIGAFRHVREHIGLETDLDAILEISKGKTTTAPERHTGEGLFFVSKAVDTFRLESGGYLWVVDNDRGDIAIGALAAERRGTLARVALDASNPRDLRALFDEYTEDYQFVRTRTVIKLFQLGALFVSRSEAKRLLHGLEKFREVVLDFRGVEAIGQGFADEVFRVWARAHPDVLLTPVEMNDAVAFMLRRARLSS